MSQQEEQESNDTDTTHVQTMGVGSGNPNSNTTATPEQAAVRSHKCSSCNCPKQRFYERGLLFNVTNESQTHVWQYSGFECASCGFMMPFKTKEMAYAPGQLQQLRQQQHNQH